VEWGKKERCHGVQHRTNENEMSEKVNTQVKTSSSSESAQKKIEEERHRRQGSAN